MSVWLTSFILTCSPAANFETEVACVVWLNDCYMQLANPKLEHDQGAEEICLEQLPERYWPVDGKE